MAEVVIHDMFVSDLIDQTKMQPFFTYCGTCRCSVLVGAYLLGWAEWPRDCRVWLC